MSVFFILFLVDILSLPRNMKLSENVETVDFFVTEQT